MLNQYPYISLLFPAKTLRSQNVMPIGSSKVSRQRWQSDVLITNWKRNNFSIFIKTFKKELSCCIVYDIILLV